MPLPDFISKICRRGLSVGGDGVITVDRSTKADYRWHYYNADGGEASLCGNGLRCVARFAYLNRIAPAKQTIETQTGIVQAEVLTEGDQEGRVRVSMPDPFDIKLNMDIPIEQSVLKGHFLNTGVPHVVYFMPDIEKIDLISLGRATRYHPLFSPNGTNANFVSVIDRHRLRIRTYERGVENETLACGTGSTAAAVVAALLGETTPPITIETQSGLLLGVDFKQDEGGVKEVFLEGDARIIYKGALSEEALL